MMPIINSPAHDYDTIWTVLQNCHKMTTKLGQRYTIITFDEQLYCKAKMLQWHHQKECEDIIILLGGFHVQMNFSKVIGQQGQGQGSTLLSPWGNLSWAQCIIAFLTYTREQQNKNTTTDTNTIRQTNILTSRTLGLIDLNCTLLYYIEIDSMGI